MDTCSPKACGVSIPDIYMFARLCRADRQPCAVCFINENTYLYEFYSAGHGETPAIEDEGKAVQGRLDSQMTRRDASPESQSTVLDTRSSVDFFRTVLPTTTATPERSSFSDSLSPHQLREPFGPPLDVANLIVHGDVEADIDMLWASTRGPGRQLGNTDGSSDPEANSSLQLTSQEAFLLQLYKNKLGTWVSASMLRLECPRRPLTGVSRWTPPIAKGVLPSKCQSGRSETPSFFTRSLPIPQGISHACQTSMARSQIYIMASA